MHYVISCACRDHPKPISHFPPAPNSQRPRRYGPNFNFKTIRPRMIYPLHTNPRYWMCNALSANCFWFRSLCPKKAMLKNLFKVTAYPNAFTSKECRKIIRQLDKPSLLSEATIVNESDSKLYQNNNYRKASGTTLRKDAAEFSWIRNRIIRYANEANKVYKTKVTGDLTDDLQFIKYGQGGHFIRHADNAGRNFVALRELSVVVQLSSPKEYRGGDLLLQTLSKNPDIAPKAQGTLIVFQSSLYHQVTPVTAGIRFSMVAWMARPPTLWDKIRRIDTTMPNSAPASIK